MSKYMKKTDWICRRCGSINDVYARKCYMCGCRRVGIEKRLPNK